MKDNLFDPSLNILNKENRNLDYFFNAKNIVLIGASEKENSVGRTILENLKSKKNGKLFFINPNHNTIFGQKSYRSVLDIKDEIDLAIIATPSETVPDIINDLVKASIPAAIIISAGFKEIGKNGIELENKIYKILKSSKLRIIGPNCLGIMSPINDLNATFAKNMALKGDIAFISQSGALCTAVLDWSLKEKIGFSAFVSIGSMIDVNWGDLISYFGSDKNTKTILLYVESLIDVKSFLSAAREVAITKPIILIKAGKTKESQKAALSHTGALTGSDDVLNAALKRVGVLRVNTIDELFSMTKILSKQNLPVNSALAIITNAGGPGVIATDALIENNGSLANLSKNSLDELNKFLPQAWSHNNPLDILGDASAELYEKTIDVVIRDSNVSAILVILTPQYMTDPTKVAEKIKRFAKDTKKPIIASWMGGKSIERGSDILTNSNIPVFSYPDDACKSFAYMWSLTYNLKGIYETPKSLLDIDDIQTLLTNHKKIKSIINNAYLENRTVLNEYESKEILNLYGIKTVETKIARNEKDALIEANKMGYPVVLKLFSKTITHKSDVGGVKLNLQNDAMVKKAFFEIFSSLKSLGKAKEFEGVTIQKMIDTKGLEIIIGSSIDPMFGPVMLFGSGGELVEVYHDRALSLPPLTSSLANRLIKETKIYKSLLGIRGKKAVDLKKLEEILVRFSYLITAFDEIKEFDINPLLASSEDIIALDSRVILYSKDEKKVTLAIRPYPSEYIETIRLKDNSSVIIHPISPEDETKLIDFYKDVSENTIRQRYLQTLHFDKLTAHERLSMLCFNDYDKEIALSCENKSSDGSFEIIAVVRLSKTFNNTASFAIIIKDSWHNKKLGTILITKMIKIAKKEHIKHLEAKMFKDNIAMQKYLKN